MQNKKKILISIVLESLKIIEIIEVTMILNTTSIYKLKLNAHKK